MIIFKKKIFLQTNNSNKMIHLIPCYNNSNNNNNSKILIQKCYQILSKLILMVIVMVMDYNIAIKNNYLKLNLGKIASKKRN